jgi:hypothetical protein
MTTTYLSILAFITAVFFPLWVPVAITVAPVVSSGFRRVFQTVASPAVA